MKLACPHCGKDVRLVLTTLEGKPAGHALMAPEPPPAPKLSKKAACGCGHEHERHEGGTGRCLHGVGTAFGGCECAGYHAKKRAKSVATTNGSTPALSKCALAVLRVVVQRGSRPTSRAQAAILAGYSIDSGGYSSALGQLRGAGLVDDVARSDGPIGMLATEHGRQVLASAGALPPALPTGSALVTYWAERLGPCAGAILQRLATAYPDEVEREVLAEDTGYSASSGGFSSALGKLRTLELVEGLRASDALMNSNGG